jgi:tetratricopeptide (TPR) repeat protein
MAEEMNLHHDRALMRWRVAAKLDPDFVLGNLMIAYHTHDPQEAKRALQRANAAAGGVTDGERMLVKWITSIREGKFLAGIVAMNDLTGTYPGDKELQMMAANWLLARYSFDRAGEVLGHVLAADPDYPPALNAAAYVHAEMDEFPAALKLVAHYAEVLPNEPNAQDSYAELLRLAGRYDEAIQHYQAALKIAPGFSILGVADTYALKGDEERARAEYRRCNTHSEMARDHMTCRLQYATTYVWEKNHNAADEAFENTAKWAHKHDLGFGEAQAHRMMAMYQPDDAAALKHLQRAIAALQEHASVSSSDRQEEMARILRWRITRAMHAGDTATANEAMQQLRSLADQDPSEAIQRAYNGALGAQLMAEGKAVHAIPYLRDDLKDGCSMALLVQAYEQTGDKEMAAGARAKLAHLNLPTIENAMVASSVRPLKAAQ